MDSRRDFLNKAALLAARGGLFGAFPASIRKAFVIDPAPGTTFLVDDLAYGAPARKVELGTAGGSASPTLELDRSFVWYDRRLRVISAPNFERRHAGHVETGKAIFRDPAMGRILA